MIQDVDETLRTLIVKRARLDETAVDVSFDQPTGEWAGSLTRPTINCYLYDIRENVELRSRDFRTERDPLTGTARRVFDPMRIDLSYILTAWTRNIRDEHALLSRVLGALAPVRAVLPSEAEPALQNQPYDMPFKVALPSEAIRNLPDLWGVMENQLRPAINTVITLALDLNEVYEAPMIFTARFDVGQYNGRSGQKTLINRNTATKLDNMYHVGGIVYKGDTPVPNAQVEMIDHPFEVLTDATGRYVFPNVGTGKYELRVTPEGGKPQQVSIEVPSERYDVKIK
jgi:hypothetical protein